MGPKEVMDLLAAETRFVRPLNYPPGTPGQGSTIIERPGFPAVAVLNLQGRVHANIGEPVSCRLGGGGAAAGSDADHFRGFSRGSDLGKIAFARMLDGRVSAVVGTHTHVQTADEQIFPGGTAFLCDGGFTGPHESVLGREIEPIITRFMTSMPQRFEVAKGRVLLQGALIEVDPGSGRALTIQRVCEPLPAAGV
jgi:calcineurin-like phosphoesterase